MPTSSALPSQAIKCSELPQLAFKLSVAEQQEEQYISGTASEEFFSNLQRDFLNSSSHLFGACYLFFLGKMMFTTFNTECDSSSRCSTASPSGDTVGYYPSPAGSYSSMGSPQSQANTITSSQPTFTSTSTSTCNSIFSSSSILSTSTISSSAVKMTDLDSSVLEESLDLLAKTEMETARSVPEVDLSNSLYTTQDWEPLHASANSSDFESLCTPVVTCTPACTTYTSSFVFTFPEAETFPTCGVAHRRGSNSNDQSSDSLSSPTLLAL
ncbi:hypothetical protein F7725_019553 [Dissostichus mawsoni]|uniref:Cellular oncogene fos n=1 Tax=Dissostichus mawsoni TaxID=36200 RepID=A0A7J5YK21_DISMA|nr:hypothetical protein F7725_019553 [Dissostichus mawsoni]